MASGPRRRDAAPSEGVRRAQRALTVLALVGVAVGTGAGYLLTTQSEQDDAEHAADLLAAEAVVTTQNAMATTGVALRGAGAVVDAEGQIDEAAFDVFASGVVRQTSNGVALGVVVDDEDRAEFEAGGIAITEPDGDRLAPAPVADEYFPIVRVVSNDTDVERVVGIDYGADPVRAAVLAAARDRGESVLSAPTALAPRGALGFVVVEPLFRRDAPLDTAAQRRNALVGYVTSAYPAEAVLSGIARELAPGTSLVIRDGEEVLFRTGEVGGHYARAADVDVLGRTWRVVVAPGHGASAALPRVVVAGGLAAEIGLLLVFGVTWRYQRRLRAANGAQRQAQARSETLEGLAARLSRSLSGAEVGHALLEQLPPFTGTTAGAVLVPDDDGTTLHLLAASGYRPDALARLETVDLLRPSAIADVVHRGEPAWLPSPLAWRDDEVTAAFGDVGRAAAIVPLVADRYVVGVLLLIHPGVRSFYDDERSLLTTVAALAARALNRARRYDAEHDAAVVLQRALLPSDLPDLPDVSVAVRYLPATDGLAVGGDWYDVFAIGDGRVGVVVGDVVGRGVRAAAAMGRLRSAMRALAEVVPEPAALLRAFEAHVPTIPDALCATMVYAVVDPAASRLSYVRAGHPPPVLVGAGGATRLLDDVAGPPLGVTGAAPPTAATLAFEPGDTLVLYTDGIVERRGEPVTVGLERLRSVLATIGTTDPEACCDRIVEAMLGTAEHGDDAAVVALRLDPIAVAGEASIDAPRPTAVR